MVPLKKHASTWIECLATNLLLPVLTTQVKLSDSPRVACGVFSILHAATEYDWSLPQNFL